MCCVVVVFVAIGESVQYVRRTKDSYTLYRLLHDTRYPILKIFVTPAPDRENRVDCVDQSTQREIHSTQSEVRSTQSEVHSTQSEVLSA